MNTIYITFFLVLDQYSAVLIKELDGGVSFLMNNHKIETVDANSYTLKKKLKIANDVLVIHNKSRSSNENVTLTLHKPIGKK